MKGRRRELGAKRLRRLLRARRVSVRDRLFYADDGEFAQRHLKNRKKCSCPMCGNPRRYAKGAERITLQERRIEAEWNRSLKTDCDFFVYCKESMIPVRYSEYEHSGLGARSDASAVDYGASVSDGAL